MRHDGGEPRGNGPKARSKRRQTKDDADLVFDFSGKEVPDLGDLSLLLTARMLAEEEERQVWVRALPEPTWRLLQALGLDHLFQLFPAGGGSGN